MSEGLVFVEDVEERIRLKILMILSFAWVNFMLKVDAQ